MEVSEKEMFQAMLDKAEKTAEEKEKKQNEGCPDRFCTRIRTYKMSDEIELPKKMLTTEELLSDFFFLIFCPNPNKNNVRVIIDDGTIKLYTNIPKFIKIIEGTMDEKAGTIVKNCCDTYGCYYVIDRCENTIRKLNISSEAGVINLQQLHNDIQKAKENGETDDALRTKYFDTLNSFVKSELQRGQKDNIAGNKYAATVVYGQNIQRGYRPY